LRHHIQQMTAPGAFIAMFDSFQEIALR
jgi:hypothetical protein